MKHDSEKQETWPSQRQECNTFRLQSIITFMLQHLKLHENIWINILVIWFHSPSYLHCLSSCCKTWRLKYRRKRGDIQIELYKTFAGKYDNNTTEWITGKCIEKQHDTRNHRFALQQSQYVHYDMRKFNFSSSIIPIWNSLPDYVFASPTINTRLVLCPRKSWAVFHRSAMPPKYWDWRRLAMPTKIGSRGQSLRDWLCPLTSKFFS